MIEIIYGHRVTSQHSNAIVDPRITISPEQLERYLQQRQAWQPLSCLTNYNGGPAFMLTFDDGYRNNLTDALPLLERFNVPCTIFVTTGFITGEAVSYGRQLATWLETLPAVVALDGATLPLSTATERKAAHRYIYRQFKRQPYPAIQASIIQLENKNHLPLPAVAAGEFLSWDEVRALDKHPLVTIGSHTHLHQVLTALSPRAIFYELRHSKRLLQQQLGHSVQTLAYPNGANSLLVQLLAGVAGYRYAFATRPQPIVRIRRWQRLSLPRLELTTQFMEQL